ncbi:MAG: hypothetical protein ACREI9_04155, partial [Nitrospiraceae bacterium]
MPPGTLDFVQTLDDAASVDPNLRRDVFMQDDFGITFGALRAETNQSLGRIKYDSASNEFRIEATTVGVAVDPALTFRTGTPAAERARITPLGALLVGATAPLAAERFRVSGGDAVLDFTSGSAFKVTQTGGANPALTVDTITAYGQVFVGDASSVGAESFGIRRDTVGSYAAIQTKNLTAAAVGTAARWEFTANETVSSDVPFGRIEWETTAVGAGVGTGKVTFSLRDVGVVNSVYEINETTDTHIWFLNGVEKMRVTAGAFTLDVTGATRITGKLTVTGSIDPTDVQLTTGTNLFFSSTDGSTAAVSAAGSGRIRYLNATPAWQVSLTTGAYSDIITAATIGTTAFVQGGNSFGAAGDLGTNDAFALNLRTTGATRWVMPTGSFDLIQQGAGTLRNTVDNALTLGTATQRLVSASSILFNVFAASGDAQPSAQLSTTALLLGVGGATALDFRIRRTGVNTATIDGNAATAFTIVPNADSNGVFGTSALRLSDIVSNLFRVFGASGAANPTAQLSDMSILSGPGGGTPLDTRMVRNGARVWQMDGNPLSAASQELWIRSTLGADYAAVLRLTGEGGDVFLGGFIQYDGTANETIIGVHDTADLLRASDIEVIRIARASPGAVGIQTAPVAGQALAFGGNLRMVGNNTFT